MISPVSAAAAALAAASVTPAMSQRATTDPEESPVSVSAPSAISAS